MPLASQSIPSGTSIYTYRQREGWHHGSSRSSGSKGAGKEVGSGPARLEVKTVGNRYSWATSRNQRSQPIQRRRHSLRKGVKTLNG